MPPTPHPNALRRTLPNGPPAPSAANHLTLTSRPQQRRQRPYCRLRHHPVAPANKLPQITTCPMHCPTQGQWWSNRSTQLLHIEQCEHRGGRYSMHVSQYFVFTDTPFTITSFVRGSRSRGVCPPQSPGDVFGSKSSSGSGGCALRGMIPGSLPDVNSSNISTCPHHHPHSRETIAPDGHQPTNRTIHWAHGTSPTAPESTHPCHAHSFHAETLQHVAPPHAHQFMSDLHRRCK